ncbi:hypothetical protein [Deinococcus cellulosilyticus]|uniref:Uncharacterized protein n=1 Tax=Deinococcus cellulosilyticus (strain DSM 18568 / NBRC 106333 / KACC 11606 / 5516J-15) TaxID=1223518 RepID=A0A511MVX9_DEIC1|nr:hypothetical protein [Deinococcus cellulosilyticus]GEM44732.1 hypothetical protein DC3_03670 [Deinococcus cellulosilyticus NBRC 106333 = KACC 11606]
MELFDPVQRDLKQVISLLHRPDVDQQVSKIYQILYRVALRIGKRTRASRGEPFTLRRKEDDFLPVRFQLYKAHCLKAVTEALDQWKQRPRTRDQLNEIFLCMQVALACF